MPRNRSPRPRIGRPVSLILAAVLGCSADERPAQPADSVPAATAVARANEASTCLVDSSGIAPIRLGMSLDEARTALPQATFERASDGDGAALVAVKLGGDDVMTVSADEADAEKPIDWSKTIESMETFNPACGTADGIRPGSLVVDVERILGRTTQIVRSEIEQREYITFERRPAKLVFRIDYTGVFPEGTRETTAFAPNAKLLSIAVAKWAG